MTRRSLTKVFSTGRFQQREAKRNQIEESLMLKPRIMQLRAQLKQTNKLKHMVMKFVHNKSDCVVQNDFHF